MSRAYVVRSRWQRRDGAAAFVNDADSLYQQRRMCIPYSRAHTTILRLSLLLLLHRTHRIVEHSRLTVVPRLVCLRPSAFSIVRSSFRFFFFPSWCETGCARPASGWITRCVLFERVVHTQYARRCVLRNHVPPSRGLTTIDGPGKYDVFVFFIVIIIASIIVIVHAAGSKYIFSSPT